MSRALTWGHNFRECQRKKKSIIKIQIWIRYFLYHNLGKVNDEQMSTFLNKGKLWFVLRACCIVQGTVFFQSTCGPWAFVACTLTGTWIRELTEENGLNNDWHHVVILYSFNWRVFINFLYLVKIWEDILISAYRGTHFSFCLRIHVLDTFSNLFYFPPL